MLFWLLDNLNFEPEDTIWVGIQQELEAEYALEARLGQEYLALDLRVVLIDFQTRGAAETLFVMLQVLQTVKNVQCTRLELELSRRSGNRPGAA